MVSFSFGKESLAGVKCAMMQDDGDYSEESKM